MTKYIFINLFILINFYRGISENRTTKIPKRMKAVIMMCHDNLYTSQLAALPCPTLYVNCDQIHR